MKVGLLESRSHRLTAYWLAYIKELGLDYAKNNLSDEEALALGMQSLPSEPLHVQLALGRILGLGRIDAVVIPQWSGATGDAWAEAFAELIAMRISGLPSLISVPDSSEFLENAAAEIGFKLTHNPAVVKRAIERVRPLANGVKPHMPQLKHPFLPTIAFIGSRALLCEEVLIGKTQAEVKNLGLHTVYGHEVPSSEVMQRAQRMDNYDKASLGEREMFGAASLLAGKSAVSGVLLAYSVRDGASYQALRRISQKIHKPTLLLEISHHNKWDSLFEFCQRLKLEGEKQASE